MKTNNTRKLVYNNKNKMKDNKLIPSIYFWKRFKWIPRWSFSFTIMGWMATMLFHWRCAIICWLCWLTFVSSMILIFLFFHLYSTLSQ
jgi:hypothetical protein